MYSFMDKASYSKNALRDDTSYGQKRSSRRNALRN